MMKLKINSVGRLKATTVKAGTVPRTLPGESQNLHQLLRAMVSRDSIPEEIRSVKAFATVLAAYKALAEAHLAFCKEVEMPEDSEMVQRHRQEARYFSEQLASLRPDDAAHDL